jgi:hypothetical protein
MVKEKAEIETRRTQTREELLRKYKEIVDYQRELRMAIESFAGELPPDSDYRYTMLPVGDAIITYLGRNPGLTASMEHLIAELDSGNVVWGAVKKPAEIVRKSVVYYVKKGQIIWTDAKQTKVKLSKK